MLARRPHRGPKWKAHAKRSNMCSPKKRAAVHARCDGRSTAGRQVCVSGMSLATPHSTPLAHSGSSPTPTPPLATAHICLSAWAQCQWKTVGWLSGVRFRSASSLPQANYQVRFGGGVYKYRGKVAGPTVGQAEGAGAQRAGQADGEEAAVDAAAVEPGAE